MRRIALSLPIVLVACSEPAPVAVQHTTQAQPLKRHNSLPADIAQGFREGDLDPPFDAACPDSQWVGYIIEGAATCPEPDNCLVGEGPDCRPYREGTWHVAPLVPAGAPRNNALRRYCTYTWERSGLVPADIEVPVERLPDEARLRLERDCDVTAPASSEFPMPGGVAIEMRAAHDRQLSPLSDGVAGALLSQIRVAVVDTAVDDESSGGPNPGPDLSENGHGDAVGTLAYRTACFGGDGAGGACVANVRSELALGRRGPRDPQAPGDINWVVDLGGDYGSQAEAARAMYDALRKFLEEREETHLILNLSFGWDAVYGDHRKRRLRVPARMALDVAQFAACEGALLIAAAGNRDSFDERDGPLAPAIWERKRNRCVGDNEAYAPVVHAVQGVDGADHLLQNARRKAIPRLLAPASFVLTPSFPPFEGFQATVRTHTGSSMAAAAVSGVAALVWSVRPDLRAHEVMDIVHASGEPLGPNAKFGLGAVRQPRVRVSACHAVELACANGCALGDQVPACGERRARRQDASPDWENIGAAMQAFWGNPAVVPAPPPPAAPVVAEGVHTEPWATPQPGIEGCPLCGIVGATLIGQIVPPKGISQFGSAKIHVDVKNVNGCGDFTVDAPLSVVSNNPFKVSLPVGNCTLKGAGIALYTQSGKLYVTASEMYVANTP